VNVIGYDAFTKLANANHNAHLSSLGPVLGPIHPNLASTLSLLSEFSGQPECSLHMSGTEAVMAAVRLCRFNTGRPLVASFAAAYHGWYDGLQPGVGGGRPVPDVIVLNDMSPLSLTTIAARASELACVIVNPLQAFTPNNPPPSDGVLMGKARSSGDDAVAGARDKYRQWLLKLRKVCDDAGVVLLFDEV
jgi:glutamate-1-semialdehyde 2,1-aminomutase